MTTTINASNSGSGGLVQTADASGVLALQTAGTTAVTVDTSQNVGIGTSSPGTKLDVQGNNPTIKVLATNLTGSTVSLELWGSAAGINYKSAAIQGINYGQLNLQTPSGVGVNSFITLATTATERMRIDSSGNVGIGTSSPVRKLTVSTAGAAEFVLQDTSQAANSRNWRIFNAGNELYFGTLNDAGSAGTDAVKITSGANLQFNSGYGSVATAYGCRAWVMFNGSNGSIFAQGNVSSITRNGTGNYRVNFSTAMPDASFSVVASCSGQGSVNGSTNAMLVNASAGGTNVTPTTTTTNLFCYHPGNSVAQDTTFVTVAVFR